MSQLINSYDNRPDASVLAGVATMAFGGLASVSNTEMAGTAAMTFGSSADLRIGGVMAANAEANRMRFAVTGTLVPGLIPLAGTASFTFGQSATLQRIAKLAGTLGMTFGEGATLRKGVQMSGTAGMTFGEAGTLKGKAKLAGTATLTFGQAATLIAPAPPTTDALEAWWSLDEQNGDRADSSANGRDLTETENIVSFNFGKVGDAAECEVDEPQILEFASAPGAVAGGSAWTFVGWFYITSSGAPYYQMVADIVRRWGGSGSWLIWVNTGGGNYLQINTDAGASYINGWTVDHDAWFFIAVRRNGTELSLSINNGTKLTETIGATGTATGDFRLLSNAASHSAHLADECAVWSSALTDAQITWLYNSGNGRAFADL